SRVDAGAWSGETRRAKTSFAEPRARFSRCGSPPPVRLKFAIGRSTPMSSNTWFRALKSRTFARPTCARGSPMDGRSRPDVHQAVGVTVRKWLQHHAIDDREHGRGGADAERDRQRHGGGEAGGSTHQSHAVLHGFGERSEEG